MEKVQIAISQNSLRTQIFRIIRTGERTTARPSGRFNLSCIYVHRLLQIQNKEETGHIDTFRLESDSPLSNLHIRCFLGAVQRSTCPIYLINTRGNVQSPVLKGNPLPSMLLLYVRWLSRGIKRNFQCYLSLRKPLHLPPKLPPETNKGERHSPPASPTQMYFKKAF